MFYYVNEDTEADQKIADDAYTLVKAWMIKQDKSRLQKAVKELTQNAFVIKQVAEFARAEAREF